jgi:lysozyme
MTTDPRRDALIAQARSYSNLMYSMDPLPDGITTVDCSLLIEITAKACGIPLPPGVRTAEQLRQACPPIDLSEVQPADLLFFAGTYDAAGPAGPDGMIASHVGFSLGHGTFRMVDAHERDNGLPAVGETNILTDYWQPKLIGAGRLPGLVDPPVITPSSSLPGIDVSEYQGVVDWAQVAASGVKVVLVRASQGTRILDKRVIANWPAVKQAGLTRLAYHFAEPAVSVGPQAEADWFIAQVTKAGGFAPGDGAMLDVEDWDGVLSDYPGSLTEWILAWLARVRIVTSITPFLYVSPSVLQEYGLTDARLAAYPLHLADWDLPAPPAAPAPWKQLGLWQYANDGVVPGITGPVDLDEFLGSATDLAAYLKGGAVPTPVDPFAKWRGVVGSGILDLMAADKTEPIMASTWLPLGRGQAEAEAEQALAVNGRIYIWHIVSGRYWVYDPAA